MIIAPKFLPRFLEECRLVRELGELGKGIRVMDLDLSPTEAEKTRNLYRTYERLITAPDCKRIMFDARQATIFDQSELRLKAVKEGKVHPPFRKFYLEFTEPVTTQTQQPGCFDVLRALAFDTQVQPANVWSEDGQTLSDEMLNFVVMFLNSPDEVEFVERGWSVDNHGNALCSVQAALVDLAWEPSEIPEHMKEAKTGFFRAGSSLGIPNRKIGWWEYAIQSYTKLLFWIFAYTMAKSVRVEEVPSTSRQMRRTLERQGRPIPPPWHVVKVEPKFKTGQGPGLSEGSTHGYRYDVIGHLRFGRHKRKDNTYSETIEWVPDHQRGLAHETYVPKTYHVEAGRKIAEKQMKQYLK